MRIWVRSAIASIISPDVSLIRRSRSNEGTAAYRLTRTPMQSNTRSAIPGALPARR